MTSQRKHTRSDEEKIYWQRKTEVLEGQLKCLDGMATAYNYVGLRQKLAYERELANATLRPSADLEIIDSDTIQTVENQDLGEGPGLRKWSKKDHW